MTDNRDKVARVYAEHESGEKVEYNVTDPNLHAIVVTFQTGEDGGRLTSHMSTSTFALAMMIHTVLSAHPEVTAAMVQIAAAEAVGLVQKQKIGGSSNGSDKAH